MSEFGIEIEGDKDDPCDGTAESPTDMERSAMREFPSGATRSAADNKLDYSGFLCPWVLERYAQYLHEHRTQADGKLRDADNWQKGIPKREYIRSLWRHWIDMLKSLRGWALSRKERQDLMCALIFNAMGWLHEDLKEARTMRPSMSCQEYEAKPEHIGRLRRYPEEKK